MLDTFKIQIYMTKQYMGTFFTCLDLLVLLWKFLHFTVYADFPLPALQSLPFFFHFGYSVFT